MTLPLNPMSVRPKDSAGVGVRFRKVSRTFPLVSKIGYPRVWLTSIFAGCPDENVVSNHRDGGPKKVSITIFREGFLSVARRSPFLLNRKTAPLAIPSNLALGDPMTILAPRNDNNDPYSGRTSCQHAPTLM